MIDKLKAYIREYSSLGVMHPVESKEDYVTEEVTSITLDDLVIIDYYNLWEYYTLYANPKLMRPFI